MIEEFKMKEEIECAVNRLRHERELIEYTYYNLGEEDGFFWSLSAPYNQILKVISLDLESIVKEELFEAITTEEFNNFVYEHVNAYIHEKKAPPKAIANAIMNITDDILSNRDPVIRAGDYIQLQNFMRG